MLIFIVQCLAISMSGALGIVLVVFGVKVISRLFDGGPKAISVFRVTHFVAEKTLVDVRLADGSYIRDRKFIGYADFGPDSKVPFDLKSWLVLESDDGKAFVKPSTVRAIIEKKI